MKSSRLYRNISSLGEAIFATHSNLYFEDCTLNNKLFMIFTPTRKLWAVLFMQKVLTFQ